MDIQNKFSINQLQADGTYEFKKQMFVIVLQTKSLVLRIIIASIFPRSQNIRTRMYLLT